MHRILVVIILTLMLIGYYIFKITTQEEPQPKVVEKKVATKVEEPTKKVVKKRPYKITKKKQDYLDMMIPPLNEVYASLEKQHQEIKALIEIDPTSDIISNLKRKYRVKSNEELLVALKPHPKSITIAQGAMESAWGTSRFYKEAYNIFGVWSFNKNDKRIAAGSQRGDKTIWLKKYDSVKESIEDYYLTMSRSKAFKAFKKLNYEVEHQNPYLLVKKLDKYSEKGALYGKELASMIDYNKFIRFDNESYVKPHEAAQKEAIAKTPSEIENPVTTEVKTVEKKVEKELEVVKEVVENEVNTVVDEKPQVGEMIQEEISPSAVNEVTSQSQTKEAVLKDNIEDSVKETQKQEVNLEAVTDALADNEDSFADILKNLPKEE